jgi:predicted protein tyrosine phosphatase
LCPSSAKLKISFFSVTGVDTFVCLQQKNEFQRFRSYEEEAKTISQQGGPKSSLTFLNFEIPDHGIAEDASVIEFVDQIAQIIRNHPLRTVLIHCWARIKTMSAGSLVLINGLYFREDMVVRGLYVVY